VEPGADTGSGILLLQGMAPIHFAGIETLMVDGQIQQTVSLPCFVTNTNDTVPARCARLFPNVADFFRTMGLPSPSKSAAIGDGRVAIKPHET
jgi:hypothetical protein